MTDPGPDDGPEPAELEPGARVEIRRRLDGRWAKGFEIARADDGGYRVRRLSDGEELPVVIATTDLRPERRRSTWWY